MVPQLVTVAPVTVAQVTFQVTVVFVLPVTKEEIGKVVFVMTLAFCGEITRETVDVVLLLPQPRAPSASMRINIEQNFHRLIPVLPKVLNIRSSSTGLSPLTIQIRKVR